MTRITIVMPDQLADQVRDAAGSVSVSAWLTNVARDELLRRECEALAAWDREHCNPDDAVADERERELVRLRQDHGR